jgi:hypothetical protein
MQNHLPVVEYLAEKGLEYSRHISADKLYVRQDSTTTFANFVEEIWEQMMAEKLYSTESRRYLNDHNFWSILFRV